MNINRKTKELYSETLTRKLHFKGSWQIHGQPHGVLLFSNSVFKRSGADLVTTMTSLIDSAAGVERGRRLGETEKGKGIGERR